MHAVQVSYDSGWELKPRSPARQAASCDNCQLLRFLTYAAQESTCPLGGRKLLSCRRSKSNHLVPVAIELSTSGKDTDAKVRRALWLCNSQLELC